MTRTPATRRALILAAGLGSRLGELTDDLPKALVEVAGRPILDYQLDALLENGVTEVGVVLGHEGRRIREHLATRPRAGLRTAFFENPDYARTNSAHSFWLAREWVGGRSYVHLNCDAVFPPGLVRRLLDDPHESVIVLDASVELDDDMEQVRLDGRRIEVMDNTRVEGAAGKAAGVARFGPSLVDWLVERADRYRRAGDLKRNCYGLIREAVNHVDVHVMDAEPHWVLEMNTPEERERAGRALRRVDEAGTDAGAPGGTGA